MAVSKWLHCSIVGRSLHCSEHSMTKNCFKPSQWGICARSYQAEEEQLMQNSSSASFILGPDRYVVIHGNPVLPTACQAALGTAP